MDAEAGPAGIQLVTGKACDDRAAQDGVASGSRASFSAGVKGMHGGFEGDVAMLAMVLGTPARPDREQHAPEHAQSQDAGGGYLREQESRWLLR